ncbi:tocopherol cyclase family protein [Lacrimispora sp. JR3]|uniref:tocopherol cyclase family protein n=1 Tax=Lacrimispora sinapis TaxID=3111456 RepID=UPI003747A836
MIYNKNLCTCQKPGNITEIKRLHKKVKTRTVLLRDSLRDLCVTSFNRIFHYAIFEGWYYKHQNKDTVLALIPGASIDKNGTKHPFLQIIWNESSYSVDFPEEDYLVDKRQQRIMLGCNVFSIHGVKLNIQTQDISIHGVIRYSSLSPIKYSIMGPFELVPFMECRHEVISMAHTLYGSVKINGRVLNFNGGKGYIEGDRGRSFPKDYLWIQCNHFREEASIVISVAHIPFMGYSFQGCICVVQYKGREYRFATYLGVKVVCKRRTSVVLKQGIYSLKVYLSNQNMGGKSGFSHKLLAPNQGKMTRFIKEEHLKRGRFLLYKGDDLVFNLASNYVSFEYEPGKI